MNKPKLLRITTVPVSLKTLLKGQLHFMNQHGFEVIGVSSEGKELQETAEQESVRTVAVNMSRKITPFQDLKSLVELIRLIKKEKPLIVHTHTPKAGLLGMLAAKIGGVPHRLHTVAGLPLMETSGMKRKVLNLVEKLTYACATNVYPNSKGLYDFILKEKFTSKDKLEIIGHGSSNGIDTAHFSPEQVSAHQKEALKKELNIQADDFVFVFVGRMVGDKGINELVAAFTGLNKPNVKLLLVGPLETELDPLQAQTLKEIETHPNIRFVGYQPDVRPYFAISDVLVFPSYREGFPNVVMQAGAMELSSIVTNINGCNEIITQGENGWIVPVKNAAVLQEKMLWCLEHPEESKAMGQQARQRIVEKYERSFVHQELLKEYESLLNW